MTNRSDDPQVLRKEKILEGIMAGTVAASDIDLAAYLGDEVAQQINTCIDRSRVTEPATVSEWIARIYHWQNTRANARVALALARKALPDYEREMPDKLHKLKLAMRELIVLSETFLTTKQPQPDQYKSLLDAVTRLSEEPGLLADQDGLINQAYRLSLALQAGRALIGEGRDAIRTAAQDAALLWQEDNNGVRTAIRSFLCPWLLGESDPILADPTRLLP